MTNPRRPAAPRRAEPPLRAAPRRRRGRRLRDDGRPARLAFGAPGDGDVLVVLTLRGGFDGLTAVAPIGDPEYRRLRPTLAIGEDEAKRIDGPFGLHPALEPLFRFWDERRLAVVHAVGQSSPSRSHATATADLERAAPSVRAQRLDRPVARRHRRGRAARRRRGGQPGAAGVDVGAARQGRDRPHPRDAR